MLYPALGISMFTHIAIIFVVKARNFLKLDRAHQKKSQNKSMAGKILLSFMISIMIEGIFLATVLSSVMAVDVGIHDSNSNFNILMRTINNLENSQMPAFTFPIIELKILDTG